MLIKIKTEQDNQHIELTWHQDVFPSNCGLSLVHDFYSYLVEETTDSDGGISQSRCSFPYLHRFSPILMKTISDTFRNRVLDLAYGQETSGIVLTDSLDDPYEDRALTLHWLAEEMEFKQAHSLVNDNTYNNIAIFVYDLDIEA